MRNVHLIVVATGGVTAGDVSGLAAANDVIVVPGYGQMESVAERVLDRLCEGKELFKTYLRMIRLETKSFTYHLSDMFESFQKATI